MEHQHTSPGFYKFQFGMTVASRVPNLITDLTDQMVTCWEILVKYNGMTMPGTRPFILLRFAVYCYTSCILIGILEVQYFHIKGDETISKWNTDKSFSLFYSQTTFILWLFCLLLTSVRMPSLLNIISWVLAVLFSQKYLFFNSFSACVCNTPMLTWNCSLADKINEQSLRWLSTHIVHHFISSFGFYELHAMVISQALNYSIRLLRIHSSKLKLNCELAGVRDLCSNSQSPFTYMSLDKTHQWSISSNAKWDISCTYLIDLLWSWNGLIYKQGLLP